MVSALIVKAFFALVVLWLRSVIVMLLLSTTPFNLGFYTCVVLVLALRVATHRVQIVLADGGTT